jgi:hypothetical protein
MSMAVCEDTDLGLFFPRQFKRPHLNISECKRPCLRHVRTWNILLFRCGATLAASSGILLELRDM